MGVLLKFEGKCAAFRAKSVHISGHLPQTSQNVIYISRSDALSSHHVPLGLMHPIVGGTCA
jgi:hypothetical protein